MSRASTILLCLLVLAVVVAALGWMRPVRPVDDLQRKLDSLTNEMRINDRIVAEYMNEANLYRDTIDSLRTHREPPVVIVKRYADGLGKLGVTQPALDSLRVVLKGKIE